MVDQVIEFVNIVETEAPGGVAFIPIGSSTAGPNIQQLIQNLQVLLSTDDPNVHELHVELWYGGVARKQWGAAAVFGIDLDLNGNLLMAYDESAGIAVEALDSTGAPISFPITYSIYASGVTTD